MVDLNDPFKLFDHQSPFIDFVRQLEVQLTSCVLAAPAAAAVAGDEADDEGGDGARRHRDDQRLQREQHLTRLNHLQIKMNSCIQRTLQNHSLVNEAHCHMKT